jgi:hypothetical protein
VRLYIVSNIIKAMQYYFLYHGSECFLFFWLYDLVLYVTILCIYVLIYLYRFIPYAKTYGSTLVRAFPLCATKIIFFVGPFYWSVT